MLYLGDYYESEVDNAIKTLSTVLEPLLLLFIGGAVGFLALSIITPIYNITGGVHR
jgi:type II secretory pathway component PulF